MMGTPDKTVCAHIISYAPLVIFTYSSEGAHNSSASFLVEPLANYEVTFIMATVWSAENTASGKAWCEEIKRFRRRYPLHRFVVFTNSQGEATFFRRQGVEAFFGHHNSLVDPSVFPFEPSKTKEFFAVYNAGLLAWKRHVLCSELPSVAFIYYRGDVSPEILKKQVPGARFMNEELAENEWLDPKQISDVLNRSQVGLCLSAVEGGMFASVEYLLSGLPVVSTPSEGGRDHFFHPDFVEIAEPSPSGVAAAANRVLARAPSGHEIRTRTIAAQRLLVDQFIQFLDRIVREEGGAGFTRANWESIYINTLASCEPLTSFLSKVPPLESLNPADSRRRRRKRLRRFFG